MSGPGEDWVVVIPFKGAPQGKSRLGPAGVVPPDDAGDAKRDGRGTGVVAGTDVAAPPSGFGVQERAKLASAFLRDTVTAVVAAPQVRRVMLVSRSPEARSLAEDLASVEIVGDPGGGLNAAVAEGIRVARDRFPTSWVAALTGDLPLLRSTDLVSALASAVRFRLAVCADRTDEGTTMITAAPGAEIVPRFGVGSFARHRSADHVGLDVPAESTIRFDIDSAADLAAAIAGGYRFGMWTAAALRGLAVV